MHASPDVPVRPAPRAALAAPLVVALAIAWPVAAPAPARADEAVYRVDATTSTLTVYAWKDGFFSSLGHDHVVSARGVTGTVVFDPARPEAGRVDFSVPATKLEVLDPSASADDRATIQKAMLADVLEVEAHPLISFRSAEVRRSARVATGTAVELDVTGDLTLHGTRRRVTLPVSLRFEGGALVARGEVTLDQPDFGIEPYSALLGAVKVRKDVKVTFEVRAGR